MTGAGHPVPSQAIRAGGASDSHRVNPTYAPVRTSDEEAGPVQGEDRPTIRLRRALAEAARGVVGPGGRDGRGRIVVRADATRHVLRDSLVIGGNTHLDATGAHFVADFPVVPATYERDPDPTHRHSPEPPYPPRFTGVRTARGVRTASMLINEVAPDARGYQAPGNIVVRGGTWDPTEHYLRDEAPGPDLDRATGAPPMNALTFQHTQDVVVQDVVVRNVKWWHAVEFNAVRNATVRCCLLQGWVEAPTVGLWHGEAVQLDTATRATVWGGAADLTPCSEIRVLHNRCGPSTTRRSWGTLLGSHTFADGIRHRYVRIEGNTVRETLWDAIGPIGTDGLVISENDIRGCWGGIHVRSVTPNPLDGVTVTGNSVSLDPNTDRLAIGVRAVPRAGISRVTVRENRIASGPISYVGDVSFTAPPQRT